MTTKSKRTGSEWESRLHKWFTAHGYPTEWVRTRGAKDQGDLIVNDAGVMFVIEAKAEKTIKLAEYMKQAQTERDNYCAARGVDPSTTFACAVVKRRNHPVERAYFVAELEEMFR